MPTDTPGDDKQAPAGFSYPMEHVRHQYVTPFGGVSGDLQPWEVGVNSRALRERTRLVPFQDRVHISGDTGSGPRPLFTRPLFTVVSLDDQRPEALEQSPGGEAVFSAHALDHVTLEHPLARVERGAPIIINATLAQRLGASDPRRFVADAVERFFGGAGHGQA